MDRDDKLDIIAGMMMAHYNGKLRAEDALTCAESVLLEIEVYRLRPKKKEKVSLSLARPITETKQ